MYTTSLEEDPFHTNTTFAFPRWSTWTDSHEGSHNTNSVFYHQSCLDLAFVKPSFRRLLMPRNRQRRRIFPHKPNEDHMIKTNTWRQEHNYVTSGYFYAWTTSEGWRPQLEVVFSSVLWILLPHDVFAPKSRDLETLKRPRNTVKVSTGKTWFKIER